MPENITFPSGVWFAPSSRNLVSSLFAPGGTASGTYKLRKGGIMFYCGNGDPWFFLVANRHGERFFVSCGKQSDGRTVYFHALSTLDEEALGVGDSIRKECELAESIWDLFNREVALA